MKDQMEVSPLSCGVCFISSPFHYRMALACSIFLCPQPYRHSLQFAFPMLGELRIFHVPLAYRKMVEVLSVRRWLIVCDGRKRSSQSSPRAFWLKPLSTFGLLVLTTFNDSSHVLTFPPES